MPGAPNFGHLCLRNASFDEASLVDHLADQGLTPHGRAETDFGAQGAGKSLHFADAEGHAVELKARA